MADSPAFKWVSEELELNSSLDRLQARGTLRLALKKAGLGDGEASVDSPEAVFRRLGSH